MGVPDRLHSLHFSLILSIARNISLCMIDHKVKKIWFFKLMMISRWATHLSAWWFLDERGIFRQIICIRRSCWGLYKLSRYLFMFDWYQSLKSFYFYKLWDDSEFSEIILKVRIGMNGKISSQMSFFAHEVKWHLWKSLKYYNRNKFKTWFYGFT